VGVLSGQDVFAGTTEGFMAKMTELGYVEGQNITYDVQKTNFDLAAYRTILQKFVADQVDLIFVFPTEASLEAKAATQGTDIPVVFANASIEGVGLVDSVREPGGNITGVRFPGPDLAAKNLEIMLALMPEAKQVWVTYLKNSPIVGPQLEVLRPVATSLGVTLVEIPAASLADAEADLQERTKYEDIGIEAMLLIPEPLTTSPEAYAVIGKFAADHRLPVGGAFMMAGEYPSVFGTAPDNQVVGEQAALLADKIFTGTPAGTIPVVSAESYVRLNYKVAQALGLTLSESVLALASEVIR
jgi:putative ABC transport system substrate-binding protein